MLGVPGTARDGGWCLRDSFKEVLGKIIIASAQISRLLRPRVQEARYNGQGRVYRLSELVAMLNDATGAMEKGKCTRRWLCVCGKPIRGDIWRGIFRA